MIHAHITTWVLAIVLFLVALGLHKSGKTRALKVVQMILRLFYLLIIGTGIWILSSLHSISMLYILKSLLGVVVIGFFEMILVRTIKGKNTAMFWVLFLIAFIAVLYLGFVKLPLTFLS
ncbi:YisL family protein [Bacillus sp. S/N-304-OC-R1]|uniref:YisL family protein n=1 Tax=Bacillus sp. S/N-304-OC-R1 TaxID=2758034 RepID=UPI001C8E9654|nr:YisL family protein [Bacillus sp. S/N-304-OC-R1]MBY0121068.1 YisL family protein [Bacillus sp. S/N-304-OC-R1]